MFKKPDSDIITLTWESHIIQITQPETHKYPIYHKKDLSAIWKKRNAEPVHASEAWLYNFV